MLRAEQAVADLHRRYLDELNAPRATGSGRGRGSKAPVEPDSDAMRRLHARVVTELFLHPVLTVDTVTAILVDADEQHTSSLLADLEGRGWIRRIGQRSDATDDEARWVAGQIIDVVTRPFHGDYSPRDPNPIDHPGIKRRTAHKVR
jgi:hypothetical protein